MIKNKNKSYTNLQKFSKPDWGCYPQLRVAFFYFLPTCHWTGSRYRMSTYEIIVPHGLTFALAFAVVLKRSSRFAAATSLYCKTKQKRHWFHKPASCILAGGLFPDTVWSCFWSNTQKSSSIFFPKPPAKCDSMTKLISFSTWMRDRAMSKHTTEHQSTNIIFTIESRCIKHSEHNTLWLQATVTQTIII